MDLPKAQLVHLDDLRTSIQSLVDELSDHPVYDLVTTDADLRVFMEHHVWAVWDFMNLLKAIQQRYTSTLIPWTPRGNGNIRRFVNEIVLDEESDKLPVEDEGSSSHFEIYLAAMAEVGANTENVVRFIDRLETGNGFDQALADSACPPAVVDFLETTWRAAQASNAELVAAFTYGRETVIPPMFRQFLARAAAVDDAPMLRFYLERHVELDGDTHGGLAEALLASTCSDDPAAWRVAEGSAKRCLKARGRLWDAVTALVAPRSAVAEPATAVEDAVWFRDVIDDRDPREAAPARRAAS